MSGTFTHSSLTTVVGFNASSERGIDPTFARYWGEIPLELSMLSAGTIDFTDDRIKLGVKDAFYGLRYFNRHSALGNAFLSTVFGGLSKLIHMVGLAAQERN